MEEKMKTRSCIAILFCILSLTLLPQQALAHNMWLNPGDHYPQVGTTVDIGIGWGHTYPANRVDQEVTEDRVEEIRAIDPDGLKADLTKASAALYKLKIEKAGVYLITARIKPGFFTMTPEGRQWGDKKTVANAVKCTNFHIEAKTVIIAGGNDKNLSATAGMPLELIPLTNPLNLKSGDKLSVKVMFNEAPLSDTSVKATYAGFEAGDIAPHAPAQQQGAQHGERHFPAETVTDAQGQASIQLDKPGFWMILLSHRPPYPDKDVCDEYMYNTAFTFEVRPQK